MRFPVFLRGRLPFLLISLPLPVPVAQLPAVNIAEIGSAFIETLAFERFRQNAINILP